MRQGLPARIEPLDARTRRRRSRRARRPHGALAGDEFAVRAARHGRESLERPRPGTVSTELAHEAPLEIEHQQPVTIAIGHEQGAAGVRRERSRSDPAGARLQRRIGEVHEHAAVAAMQVELHDAAVLHIEHRHAARAEPHDDGGPAELVRIAAKRARLVQPPALRIPSLDDTQQGVGHGDPAERVARDAGGFHQPAPAISAHLQRVAHLQPERW